ncbi:MAG: hypothetical protein HYZ19_01325 [Rhodocyclales bacterium]|nr:hypothetical protein [Rhodocyclales bacterium]
MKAMRRWLGAMALILAWLPGAPGAAVGGVPPAPGAPSGEIRLAPGASSGEIRLAPGIVAGAIPLARDLSVEAREAGPAVVLVLYSQADCRWCERARREVLIPLQNDPAWQGRVLIRQVDLDSDAPLADFAGRKTTHRRFARAEGAKVTPTLAVYGPGGARLAEPIVGFRTADFYGTYVERALEEALAKQGRTAR